MYDTELPYLSMWCTYNSFVPLGEAIGQFGLELKPQSYYQFRVPLLKKKDRTCLFAASR